MLSHLTKDQVLSWHDKVWSHHGVNYMVFAAAVALYPVLGAYLCWVDIFREISIIPVTTVICDLSPFSSWRPTDDPVAGRTLNTALCIVVSHGTC